VLDRKRMNLPTTVFVVIRTTRHAADWLDEFRQALAAIPEIVEVHRLTGNFDYILKLVLPNVESYDTIYKALVRRIELSDVSAYISMETLKDETALPTGYAVSP
ncbi:MAG: Lrp/AsnC family transcriptional regulator, partial [Rhodospirillales bacterium]|nr:Lrp/AsnC family transcriptional regulator [Rhodospirillales bacterium]